MAIAPGSRLGPYEIVSPLGAGGMGEVYRARDTRLQREVAIKVVSTTVHDADRAARFEREAQLLAALKHPHIAQVYGFEAGAPAGGPHDLVGAGFSQPVHALVMELVEGESLAAYLARGAMPVPEALRVASQIADALQAAHEKGIIHRDLKPANVMLDHAGDAKVLDFGLAKAIDDAPVVDASHSPTLTFAATQAGVILGTAAYMAPEQAKGRAADRRSDMWAFACVLFEMLTGRRAFAGEDASDTMAAVLRGEPEWAALPAALPSAVERLLRRCLEKDRRARSVDAGAALFVLRECVTWSDAAATTRTPAASRRWLVAAASALLAACAAAAVTALLLRPAAPRVTRLVASSVPGAPMGTSPAGRDLAISPDGSRLVYVSAGNAPVLQVRDLDRLDVTTLAGTENAINPFFSPDGKWIGFYSEGFLRKVSVQGGTPSPLAPMNALRGAAWGSDDVLIIANTNGRLLTMPARGGTPKPVEVTTNGQSAAPRAYRWPTVLPDGRHLLVTRGFGQGPADPLVVAWIDLTTGVARDLFAGTNAVYVPTGHIVYGLDGTLRAVRFDADRGVVSGDSTVVVEHALTKGSGAIDFDVSADGTLVYANGGIGTGGRAATVVAMFDRQGRATDLPAVPTGSYRDVRVSPDGRRLAVSTFDDVWTYDFARSTFSRLTTAPGPERSPLWSRDGLRVLFTRTGTNAPEVMGRAADGTGSDQLVFTRAKDALDTRAEAWSPDGKVLFTEVAPTIICEIGEVDPTRPTDARILVHDGSCAGYPAISPDGHWIAYMSDVSGRSQVYVERYPEMGARQQISIDGGTVPAWSANGRELYFMDSYARQVLAVTTDSGPTLAVGQPKVVFEGEFLPAQTGWRPYDAGPDGRFVIIRSASAGANAAAAPSIVLVQHWFEELKRLVASK